MSDNKTHPELGQLLHGNMIGEFNISNIGEAAVMWALRDCERVFWNANQRSLEDFCGWDSGDALGEMKTRRYWWGDENTPEAALPNMEFNGVHIRWYKYPGRGMSCNLDMTPDQWAQWLDAALAYLGGIDKVTLSQ